MEETLLTTIFVVGSLGEVWLGELWACDVVEMSPLVVGQARDRA